MSELMIPADLLPADGRFGSGPSKVRPEALRRLAEVGDGLLGTSHRQSRVRDQVRRLQEGVRALYELPDDYEVLLTLGGATAFWDVATHGLIERRSRHYAFGEFGTKFARMAEGAPWLEEPDVVTADYGRRPELSAAPDCDVQALPHNETSTGVMLPPRRVDDALVLVDGTSAAGGLAVDAREYDVYYFSLQKGFSSEGGLTVAIVSPAAVERIEAVRDSGRYIPTFFDLATALDNSRKYQSYNTPAVATVFLAAETVDWLLETFGRLQDVESVQRTKAEHVYGWAGSRPWARPFVEEEAARSLVIATVDLDESLPVADVNAVLRANGVLDTEPYRKLGRNQLRIGMFPAITAEDLQAYTACVDWVVDHL